MIEINKTAIDMATALDLSIRDKEGKEAGYEINNEGENKKYYNYMSNAVWEKFISQMREGHKSDFNDGNGGELKEKKGRYGINPPKMASFGSSSRLVYELSRDIENFSFEKKLPTCVGGVANIDGYVCRGNECIYVEAKRREIYGGSHENEKISVKYEDVYKKINEMYPSFSYESNLCTKAGYKKYTFMINKEEVDYFDMKQLICHFLGITNEMINKPISNVNVKFLYLLYNPNEDDVKMLLEKNYNKYSNNVLKRFVKVNNFIRKNLNAFKEIFYAVLDYQVETCNKEKPKIEFEMKLVDQTNYKSEFE